MRLFLVALELGLYRAALRSDESEGPVGLCVIDGRLESCPSNPPFTSFSRRDVGFGVELGAGGVVTIGRGAAHVVLELRKLRSWIQPLPRGRAVIAAFLAL